MAEEICAFRCSFCPKVSQYKASITRHEKTCFSNPATRSCQSCKHFSRPWMDAPYLGHQLGEATYGDSYQVDWCKHFEELEKKKTDCKKFESREVEVQVDT